MNSQEYKDSKIAAQVEALIKAYRSRCLWYLREDYIPETPEQAIRTLEMIERHADRSGYIEARKLREWLLRNTSGKSAG
jgi:hypothetical protein